MFSWRHHGFVVTMKTLQLANLAKRHYGLTESLGNVFEEAASVKLSKHHNSPALAVIFDGSSEADAELTWSVPSGRIIAAHGNAINATEVGAYGLALAAPELTRGIVAIRRAEQGSGADYYLAPLGSTEHGNPPVFGGGSA